MALLVSFEALGPSLLLSTYCLLRTTWLLATSFLLLTTYYSYLLVRLLRAARPVPALFYLLTPPAARAARPRRRLNYNAIAGREGGEAVAELLRSLPAAVKEVDLNRNQLGPEGGKSIAAALPASAVKSMDLGNNQLGPEGGKAIAAALPASAVEEMWLSGNGFNKKTKKALRDAWGDRPGDLEL